MSGKQPSLVKTRAFWSGALGGGVLCALAAATLLSSAGAHAQGPGEPVVVRGPVASERGYSTAQCPDGMRVINGGFHASKQYENNEFISTNAPLDDGTGWQARFSRGQAQAFALCVTPTG